eukprot:GHVN01100854.1.p1 GENE.GHVN01100854.1~~GHVN01100854.1.p1  ORF type:complete len:908 (+),score=81.13 GHVN01100854.1:5876-8599(+)
MLSLCAALCLSMPLLRHCLFQPTPCHMPPAIIKSDSDTREYRYIVLDNGLCAMLVHDKDTDISSASLSVGSGSRDDGDIPGLAHFLEHLLFMGTEKYPGENDYSQFLAEHGGSSNAYTCYEHTNYYFDVTKSHLFEALDRFAQFFIAPLLLDGSIERERLAVDSEYKMYLKNDYWRLSQVVKHVSDKEHPFNAFSVGTKETLDVPIERVRQFYEENYSADRMCLVVYGREDVFRLEEIVRALFTSVPRKDIRGRKLGPPCLPANRGLFYKALEKTTEMQFLFEVPCQNYRRDPVAYIAHVLASKYEQSVFSILKKRLLITDVWFCLQEKTHEFSHYAFVLRLTPKGRENIAKIVETVFKGIKTIFHAKVIPETVSEVSMLFEHRFRHTQKTAPDDYVSALAENMHYVCPEDILRADCVFDGITDDELEAVAGFFLREKTLVTCILPELSKPSSREPWFGSEFYLEGLQTEEAAREDICPADEEIKHPPKNMFLSTQKPLSSPESLENIPRLISNGNTAVWHAQQTTSRLDVFVLFSAQLYTSPRMELAARILLRIIESMLRGHASSGHDALLDCEIEITPMGASFLFSGLEQKLILFIEKTFTILDGGLPEDAFLISKQEISEELLSFDEKSPYKHISSAIRQSLLAFSFSEDELKQVLPAVSSADVSLLWNTIRKKPAKPEILFNGNISKERAMEASHMLGAFVKEKTPACVEPRNLFFEEHQTINFKSLNDTNSATAVIIKAAALSDQNAVALSYLLNDIINEEFFDQLRTKEQLGYICQAPIKNISAVLYQCFIVQSEKPCVFLHERIKAFISEMGDIVDALDKVQFNDFVEARKMLFKKKADNLEEYTAEYSKRIKDRDFCFQWREKAFQALAEVTREDLAVFCSKIKNAPFLAIYVNGRLQG